MNPKPYNRNPKPFIKTTVELAVRLRVPAWAHSSQGSAAPDIRLNGRLLLHPNCGGGGGGGSGGSTGASGGDPAAAAAVAAAGWCDVTRTWSSRDVLTARFPLIVRAEPLLVRNHGFGFGIYPS